MAEKRNLTIQPDAEIIRKARVLAVKRSVSLSRLVAEQLERMVGDEERYQIGCRQAIVDLRGTTSAAELCLHARSCTNAEAGAFVDTNVPVHAYDVYAQRSTRPLVS